MPDNISIFLLLIISFSFFQFSKSENENSEFSKEVNETLANEEEDNTLDKLNYTNIIYLEDSNYTLELKKNGLIYLVFYEKGCKFCKEFMPIFIETAEYCKSNDLGVNFARIETGTSPNATEEYNVFIEPAIFLIKNGIKNSFEGAKTKEGLLKFLKKIKSDDIFKINKLEEINEYINSTSIVLLSTIKDKSMIIYQSFSNMAKGTAKYDFVSCLSEECYKKYGEDIILFKKYDEKENSYSKDYGKLSEAKENSLEDFISIYSVECGALLTINQIVLLGEFQKQAVIYVRNKSNEEHIKYDILFKELGKVLRKNNIYTFVSDIGEEGGTNIEEAFSILPEELPCVFYYNQFTGEIIANVKIFSIRNLDVKKLNIEYLKNFINDAKNEKIKRDLFSEPPSQSKKVNGLKYVIGRTFDRDVIEEKKNVFLALVEDEEDKPEDKKFIEILSNISSNYEDICFSYINIEKNEPRDLPVRKEILPLGYLYTNAMDKKEIIKFVPKNISKLNEKEIKIFLDKNIKKIKNEENKEVKTSTKENIADL